MEFPAHYCAAEAPVCRTHDRDRNVVLLAPAGSVTAVGVALSAGADAIYAGLKGCSRGGSKAELTEAEFSWCLHRAHESGAAVQLAANIIPKSHERASLLRRLASLAHAGLNAVIVNDLGFLREIRRNLPQLRVTASIGCGALNADDARFYEALGADAVVLPGNLDPDEIAAIKARAAIKVEVMLHMVQEFTNLGRCWMPSYHHFHSAAKDAGRLTGSVKRGGVGACFKICQQPWSVFRDQEQVDERTLPSRQISRVSDIGGFLDAGVDIVKLQGRSLPTEVLGELVARYRHAIDAWRAGVQVPIEVPTLAPMWTVQGR
jgi:putative protease